MNLRTPKMAVSEPNRGLGSGQGTSYVLTRPDVSLTLDHVYLSQHLIPCPVVEWFFWCFKFQVSCVLTIRFVDLRGLLVKMGRSISWSTFFLVGSPSPRLRWGKKSFSVFQRLVSFIHTAHTCRSYFSTTCIDFRNAPKDPEYRIRVDQKVGFSGEREWCFALIA